MRRRWCCYYSRGRGIVVGIVGRVVIVLVGNHVVGHDVCVHCVSENNVVQCVRNISNSNITSEKQIFRVLNGKTLCNKYDNFMKE